MSNIKKNNKDIKNIEDIEDSNKVVILALLLMSSISFILSTIIVNIFFVDESTLKNGVKLILTLSILTTFYAPLKLIIKKYIFR